MKRTICLVIALGLILLAASALAETDIWTRIFHALEAMGYSTEKLQPNQYVCDSLGTTFSVSMLRTVRTMPIARSWKPALMGNGLSRSAD